jgi:hypothetical protein
MVDPQRELKIRAEILQRRIQEGEPAALERLRVLPEHRQKPIEALREAAGGVQRKHCLAAVAREAGFGGWEHALRVLAGDVAEVDFGDALYPHGASARLNHWFASYEEARAALAELGPGQYLLAYRRHFLIVDRDFIGETLGLDPDDADWAALGWDWARPKDVEARRRLYGKLLEARAPKAA